MKEPALAERADRSLVPAEGAPAIDAPIHREDGEATGEDGESRYEAEVRANLRRNYFGHLCHGLLGQTGFNLIMTPTFIPAYVHLLSGSDTAVGIALGLQHLGSFFSPIIGATIIEHRKRVLPVGMLVGGAMRIQVLGIALGGLLLAGLPALVAVCLFLTLLGVFMGMQGVIFNFLMSKVIPVNRRGFLVGLRNFLSGLTSAAVAYVGGTYLIEQNALGNGYSATFLVAFVLTAIGLLMLLIVREPEPPRMRPPGRVQDRFRDLPSLLRADPAFTRFFLARGLGTLGTMAVPFYVLYAGTQIELTGANLGLLSLAFLLSQTATNLGWGWVADRTGFRLVFMLSLAVWVLSTMLLMQLSGAVGMAAVFIGLGAGIGGFQIAAQNLVLEFGSREDLPMRIAVSNSASSLMAAVGPLLGGAMLIFVPYAGVFLVAIAVKMTALVLIWLYVDEPRHRPRTP